MSMACRAANHHRDRGFSGARQTTTSLQRARNEPCGRAATEAWSETCSPEDLAIMRNTKVDATHSRHLDMELKGKLTSTMVSMNSLEFLVSV